MEFLWRYQSSGDGIGVVAPTRGNMTPFARILAVSLVLFLPGVGGCSQTAEKPIDGLWGGKWDDTWPVYIEVHPGDQPGEYKVEYRWLENGSDMEFSHQEHLGRKVGNHIEAGFLIFMVDDHSGILYGAFDNPRMANLVRIPSTAGKLEEISLEDYGWKPGAIPADEALAKIKAHDGAN